MLPHVDPVYMVERAFLHVNVLCMVAGSFFTWWKVSVTRCLWGEVRLHGAKHASPCRPCLHGGTCFPACKIDGDCTKNRCLDSVLGAQKDGQKVRWSAQTRKSRFLKKRQRRKCEPKCTLFFFDFLGPLEETLCVFCFACCVLFVVLFYMVESLGYSLSWGCSAFTWGEARLAM